MRDGGHGGRAQGVSTFPKLSPEVATEPEIRECARRQLPPSVLPSNPPSFPKFRYLPSIRGPLSLATEFQVGDKTQTPHSVQSVCSWSTVPLIHLVDSQRSLGVGRVGGAFQVLSLQEVSISGRLCQLAEAATSKLSAHTLGVLFLEATGDAFLTCS